MVKSPIVHGFASFLRVRRSHSFAGLPCHQKIKVRRPARGCCRTARARDSSDLTVGRLDRHGTSQTKRYAKYIEHH